MTISIVSHSLKDVPVSFNAAEECVATRAQEATHMAANVAVIHEEITLHAADQASPSLRLVHGLNIFRSQPILAHEAGPKVFRPSSLRVLTTPFAKALVTAFAVRFAVLASCLISAGLAIGTDVLARLCKPVKRKGLAALRTRLHAFSMAYKRGMTGSHADVLLELANGPTS